MVCEYYEENFGRLLKGIWLLECVYYEGVERMLVDVGLCYFLVDGYGILYVCLRLKFGIYVFIFIEIGVVVFGWDYEFF